MISRIMLFVAAVRISAGWALGVWLPFGPLCFRRTFPDQSRASAPFRTLTILCFGIYVLLGLGSKSIPYLRNPQASAPTESPQATGYAIERSDDSEDSEDSEKSAKTHVSLGDRRAANAKELDRLAKWSEDLKLKKRDLLRSDIQGNKDYEGELAEYTEAFTKATAERESLGLPPVTGH